MREDLLACIKTVSMQSSKCCFSLPGKLAEASTHWAQCERAERPPPARKGECCRQTYAGKGIVSGQQYLCADGHISDVYRWCLLSYCDTSWSTGLCKKPSLWQCTKRRSCWERHAFSLLLHRAAIWLFTSAVLSHPKCSVFWWSYCFPPYIFLSKGCNSSRNCLQPEKALHFI